MIMKYSVMFCGLLGVLALFSGCTSSRAEPKVIVKDTATANRLKGLMIHNVSFIDAYASDAIKFWVHSSHCPGFAPYVKQASEGASSTKYVISLRHKPLDAETLAPDGDTNIYEWDIQETPPIITCSATNVSAFQLLCTLMGLMDGSAEVGAEAVTINIDSHGRGSRQRAGGARSKTPPEDKPF